MRILFTRDYNEKKKKSDAMTHLNTSALKGLQYNKPFRGQVLGESSRCNFLRPALLLYKKTREIFAK